MGKMSKETKEMMDFLAKVPTMMGQLNMPPGSVDIVHKIRMVVLSADQSQNDWVMVSDRLPSREDCQKNDNRFILDDGNRRYEGIFDYEQRKFMTHDELFMKEDDCAAAWMPMPDACRQLHGGGAQ